MRRAAWEDLPEWEREAECRKGTTWPSNDARREGATGSCGT